MGANVAHALSHTAAKTTQANLIMAIPRHCGVRYAD